MPTRREQPKAQRSNLPSNVHLKARLGDPGKGNQPATLYIISFPPSAFTCRSKPVLQTEAYEGQPIAGTGLT